MSVSELALALAYNRCLERKLLLLVRAISICLCLCLYKTHMPNISSPPPLQEGDMDSLVAHSRKRQFEVQRDMSSKALADRFQLEQEVQRLQQELNAAAVPLVRAVPVPVPSPTPAAAPTPTPSPSPSPAIEFIEVMFLSCTALH
jgi:hypothetical protein